MLSRSQYQEAVELIAMMNRTAIVGMIRRSPTRFPIDFTDTWLASRSLEELRHVLAAICLHCEVMPPVPAAAAVNTERAA